MIFRDRDQAARLLELELSKYRSLNPLVLGVPRGAVPMAKIIAEALGADLDIVLVHKFAAPENPEYALGSVSEDGGVYLGVGAQRAGLSESDVAQSASREIAHLQVRRRLYTPHRRPVDVRDRVVILVDDGIATGATMIAAVRHIRERGAAQVIVAAPVASSEAINRLSSEGAEVAVVYVPTRFAAVSQFYHDFSEVDDSEVVRALAGEAPEIEVHLQGVDLKAILKVPDGAHGLVVFAHGSGSGRKSTRNQFVAGFLNDAGFATLLIDLLDERESHEREHVFDILLLSERLNQIEEWLDQDPQLRQLPLGLFGASTGAAAAIASAARRGSRVRALVSRGGRPDLATVSLSSLKIPTLFICGGLDEPVLTWNRNAFSQLGCEKELVVIDGAGHLFEEPGALEQVASLARQWFDRHLRSQKAHAAQSLRS